MSKLDVCLRHISEVYLYEYYCLGSDEYEICLVVAFLCYELSDVTPMNTRLIITCVGTVITILLNIRFWIR